MDYDSLRNKFTDKAFAEKFFCLSTEQDECQIDEIQTSLPIEREEAADALIVYMKGSSNGKPFEYVLFKESEYPDLMQSVYLAHIWGQYHPVTDDDFGKLPFFWGVTFSHGGTAPIGHVRWVCDEDPSLELETGEKLNIISTDVDSEIMRLVNN